MKKLRFRDLNKFTMILCYKVAGLGFKSIFFFYSKVNFLSTTSNESQLKSPLLTMVENWVAKSLNPIATSSYKLSFSKRVVESIFPE